MSVKKRRVQTTFHFSIVNRRSTDVPKAEYPREHAETRRRRRRRRRRLFNNTE